MHDDVMDLQLIPLTVFYLCFLGALDWVRQENAPVPVRKKAR